MRPFEDTAARRNERRRLVAKIRRFYRRQLSAGPLPQGYLLGITDVIQLLTTTK